MFFFVGKGEILLEGVGEYTVKLKTKAGDVKILLTRHLSPITVERLYKNVPLSGLTIKTNDLLYISINLEGRLERPLKKLKKGQLVFSPANKSLIIALTDLNIDFPATPLEEVLEGMEVLRSIGTGEKVVLST